MNRICLIVACLLVMINMTATAGKEQTYRDKYANVLKHYSLNMSDSLKYKAAVFIIDNMEGHISPEGTAIEKYIYRIETMEKATGIRQLMSEWYKALKEGTVSYKPDSAVVSDTYLIKNIDAAFDSWEKAPWKDEITFAQFCKYILPYRINDEHIGSEWRIALRRQYGSLIQGTTDMRRAFAIIKDSVYKNIVLSNKYCQYTLDPMTCNIIGRAECGQRCILLVAVLRALCIPAVIDSTPLWADYSNKSHAWVAMVASNGDTYTVYENDSIAKMLNPIDASEFLSVYKIKPEDNFPYTVKTTKTPIKIYRICFDHCNEAFGEDETILSSPFLMDVSQKYGLNTNIKIKAGSNKLVYLCSYMSGTDWMPIAKSKSINNEVTFNGIGNGTVCVPVILNQSKMEFLSCPFLIGSNGIEKFFVPSQHEKQTICINRKYPLCSYITDKWAFMIGGTFEASMTDTFQETDTLAMITTIPFGMTSINISSPQKYRFMRFHAPKDALSSISELQFYTTDKSGKSYLLTGRKFAIGMDKTKLNSVFDGNPATYCKGTQKGYSIGIDLGENNEKNVSKIIFCPGTDLNFVERGHLYELYYFDTNWHLIQRIYSKGDYLTFENVPKGALLLLKDKTAGYEERIFEYTNGKQVWY